MIRTLRRVSKKRQAQRRCPPQRCEIRTPRCTGDTNGGPHHRKLVKHGRDDRPCNILDCCFSCHRWVHDHPRDSYEAGWLVHPWDDPESVEVRRSA